MDALTILKLACVQKPERAQFAMTYKNFDQIHPGEYIVTKFEKRASEKYGEQVRITVGDWYMNLPPRFNGPLTDVVIDELNKTPKIMVYGGKNQSEYNRLILDFKDASAYVTQFINSQELSFE